MISYTKLPKHKILLSAWAMWQHLRYLGMRIHDTGLAGKACELLLIHLGCTSSRELNQQPSTCGNIRDARAEVHLRKSQP
jgi:hypothetical protein